MKVGVMNTPQDGRARAATFQNYQESVDTLSILPEMNVLVRVLVEKGRHSKLSTKYNIQITVLNDLMKLRPYLEVRLCMVSDTYMI